MFSRKTTIPTISAVHFLNYEIFSCNTSDVAPYWTLLMRLSGTSSPSPSHNTMQINISERMSVMFFYLFSWDIWSWTFWVKSLQMLSLTFQCSNFTYWRWWPAQEPCQALALLLPRLPPGAHGCELLQKEAACFPGGSHGSVVFEALLLIV